MKCIEYDSTISLSIFKSCQTIPDRLSLKCTNLIVVYSKIEYVFQIRFKKQYFTKTVAKTSGKCIVLIRKNNIRQLIEFGYIRIESSPSPKNTFLKLLNLYPKFYNNHYHYYDKPFSNRVKIFIIA